MENSNHIFCQYCSCRLNPKNLKKHLKKCHLDKLTKRTDKFCKTEDKLLKKKIFKYTKIYYQCKQCKRKITKNSLLSHLNKIHDFFPKNTSKIEFFYFNEVKVEFIKELKSETQKQFENTYGKLLCLTHKDIVPCGTCSKSVGKENIIHHYKEDHHVDMSNIKQQIDFIKPKNKSNATICIESQDIFDRQIKLNGGGYGLGKNRKH